MKKTKIITKKHITLAVMVLALGAAVWVNMRYGNADNIAKSTSSKYLGEAEYVDSKTDESAVETSAKPDNDYFENLKTEREETRKSEIEILDETIKDNSLDDNSKQQAVSKKAELVTRIENEQNIETLLAAKGFKNSIAVMGDGDINIIVKKDSLSDSETLQIQDAAGTYTGLSLSNVKIVTVK